MQQIQLFCMQWDKWSQVSDGFVFLAGSSHVQQGASSDSGLWIVAKFRASFSSIGYQVSLMTDATSSLLYRGGTSDISFFCLATSFYKTQRL